MKKTKKSSASSKPLTKAQLDSSLSALESRLLHRMDVKDQTIKSEWMHHIDVTFEKFSVELMRYMDLKTEIILSYFRDMFTDRTSQHDDKLTDHEHRLKRVEDKVGLAL